MRSRSLSRAEFLFAAILLFGSIAFAGDYRQHQSNMNGKKAKIAALEGEIRELIHHKKSTEVPEEIKLATTMMAEKHKELETVSKEYRDELLHIRFKHPEKGDEAERKYPRYSVKTLNEMESEFGLDGKLDRIRKRVQVTFGMKKPEPVEDETHVSSEKARQPAQENRPAEADERIRVSR